MKIAVVNLITKTPLARRSSPEVKSNKDAMIVKFSQELQHHGMDIDLYISDSYRPPVAEDLGICVKYLPTIFKPVFWPSFIPCTPSLFKELRNNYDFVICSEVFQWSTVFAVLSRIFSRQKKPAIVIWQEMSKHQKMLKEMPSRFFHRIVLRYFLDRHIALYVPRSDPARAFLMRQGIGSAKIAFPIPHGIDQSVFFYDPAVKKENYIFSPSRLVFSKGIDVLLKAFSRAQEKLRSVHLIIQGEGPELERYRKLAETLRIGDKVIFCTDRLPHEEMRARYQKALVTVISSRSDLFIFSIMESMACGTPVFVSTGVDSHALFLDHRGGMVFKNEDYEQLSDLLIKYMNDSALRIRMEKEAVEEAKLYSNHRLAGIFVTLLVSIKLK